MLPGCALSKENHRYAPHHPTRMPPPDLHWFSAHLLPHSLHSSLHHGHRLPAARGTPHQLHPLEGDVQIRWQVECPQ